MKTTCGDDCKLVEMLASRTSKEQAMENAVAAIQSQKLTVYGAAKVFSLADTTLRRELDKRGITPQTVSVTTKARPTPEERDQWWEDFQAGKSLREIADSFERGRNTVTTEIKKRKDTEDSTAIEQPSAKPQIEPKVKRPKELANMLDTHQKYIKDRLLPIAQKLAALHNEVQVEQKRLHTAWTKDNLVFTEPYQRCVDYWNEREMFGDFAEAFDDPAIKTYADVLAAIRVKFRRCSERMETIQYSTGCIPDPNKRDLRI